MALKSVPPHATEMDVEAIMRRIPHRYPMLLIDRIIDIVPGERCVGIKNVSMNEPYFAGHFPGRPIMPGVLIVEAMAQTGGAMVCDWVRGDKENNDLVYFMSIEEARFRKPVVPGDTLQLRMVKDRQRGSVWRFQGKAFVGDTLCAEAVITAMLMDGDPQK